MESGHHSPADSPGNCVLKRQHEGDKGDWECRVLRAGTTAQHTATHAYLLHVSLQILERGHAIAMKGSRFPLQHPCRFAAGGNRHQPHLPRPEFSFVAILSLPRHHDPGAHNPRVFARNFPWPSAALSENTLSPHWLPVLCSLALLVASSAATRSGSCRDLGLRITAPDREPWVVPASPSAHPPAPLSLTAAQQSIATP